MNLPEKVKARRYDEMMADQSNKYAMMPYRGGISLPEPVFKLPRQRMGIDVVRMSEEIYLMNPLTETTKFLAGKQANGEINRQDVVALTKFLRTNYMGPEQLRGRGQGNTYVFTYKDGKRYFLKSKNHDTGKAYTFIELCELYAIAIDYCMNTPSPNNPSMPRIPKSY